jgi:glutathione S-transferase
MAMCEIILHHYPMSTFSEKARLACGLKKLSYKQVFVPIASPKPELVSLTGGYRRAPVMQIGADIYCDSHLILRKIEQLHPEPTLFPNRSEGEATALAWWAERYIFMPALGFIAYINGDLYAPDFVEERRKFGYVLDKEELKPLNPRNVQQLVAHLAWLRNLLADERPYLLGDQVSAADLAAYPSLWFLRKWGGEETERQLPIKPLLGWIERVATLGYGSPTEIAGAAALDIARQSTPTAAEVPADGDPTGIKAGAKVTVTPDDVGRDPVEGVLVAADDREVVIRRSDMRGGLVHVHFPRAGYDLASVC